MTIKEAIKYLSDKTSNPHLTTSYVGVNWKEVYDMAIEALEKQIPKKPIQTDESKRYDSELCPVCKNIVRNGEYRDKYCSVCGQRIVFEEGDANDSK